MTKHLTEQQIAAWIQGERSPEAVSHVRECAACEALAESMLLFRGSVCNLAEQQTVWRVPPSRMPRWAVAGIALLMLAAFPLYESRRAAIARQDAALLEQVNAELAQPVPQSMEPLAKLWRNE